MAVRTVHYLPAPNLSDDGFSGVSQSEWTHRLDADVGGALEMPAEAVLCTIRFDP